MLNLKITKYMHHFLRPRQNLFLLPILFVFVFSPSLFARQTPLLEVKESQKSIQLESVSIDITVTGNFAVTNTTMVFYNPNDRILQGKLSFPLADGQEVYRYALDVNGKLREGVVVEKNKGQKAFDEVVRQAIDPGLLEKTVGNNYKTRIYPIPAKGRKTVVVGYQEELRSLNLPVYYAALNYGKVEDFQIKIEVINQEVAPQPEDSNLTNFSFEKWRSSYLAEKRLTDYDATGVISFTIPRENKPTVYRMSDASGDFFYAHMTIQPSEKAKPLPNSQVIGWDVSHSMRKRDIEKEIAFIEKYYSSAERMKVKVISFSNTLVDERSFQIVNGNTSELSAYLRSTVCDGGTSSLPLKTVFGETAEVLFFTDGIINLDDDDILPNETTVNVITSTLIKDQAMIGTLTARSGGRKIDLTTTDVDAAVTLMNTQPFRFLNARYDTEYITEVYPQAQQDIIPGKTFSIAGRIKPDMDETIELEFGYPGKIVQSKKIRVKPDAQNAIQVQRLWAGKKLNFLLSEKADKAAIIAHAVHYGLVTDFTSLIVLDRIEDYVRYEIEPPVELRDKYLQMLAKAEKQNKADNVDYLQEAIKRYQLRVDWWQKELKAVKRDEDSYLSEEIDFDFSEDAPRYKGNVTRPPMLWGVARSNEMRGDSESDETVKVSSESDETETGSTKSDETETGSIKSESDLNITRRAIAVKVWDPDEPYLKKITQMPSQKQYEQYLLLKPEFEASPTFYLAVGDHFIRTDRRQTGLRILSNIVELSLEEPELLKILAYKYKEFGKDELSVFLFEKIAALRPDEMQSVRDLSLMYINVGQYQKALDLLIDLLKKQPENRFTFITSTIIHEINTLIASHGESLDLSGIPENLIVDLPVDVRIVLDWNVNDSDMDLWVIEPNGEECYWLHKLTSNGGRLTRNITGGYGPEEYLIKKAIPGKYVIKVKYYDDWTQKISGPVTLLISIFTNYGRDNEELVQSTVQLKSTKDMIEIADFSWE